MKPKFEETCKKEVLEKTFKHNTIFLTNVFWRQLRDLFDMVLFLLANLVEYSFFRIKYLTYNIDYFNDNKSVFKSK